MATGATKAETKGEPEVAVEPEKGKSRKLLIIGVIAAVLVIGGGVGAYFFMHKPPAEDSAVEEKVSAKPVEKASSKSKEKGPHKPMMYVPLETFTVNLQHGGEERFLQTTINLEVIDSTIANAVKDQMPLIRSRVLLLLSSQDTENLMTREGKEKLTAEIATELRKMLDGPGPSKGLEQVLFTHFVIQ